MWNLLQTIRPAYLLVTLLVLAGIGCSDAAPALRPNGGPEAEADPWKGDNEKRQVVGYEVGDDYFFASSTVNHLAGEHDSGAITTPTLPPLPDNEEYAKETSDKAINKPDSQLNNKGHQQQDESAKPKEKVLNDPQKSSSDPKLSAKEKEIIKQLDRRYKVHGEGKDKVVWLAAPKRQFDKDGRVIPISNKQDDGDEKKKEEETSFRKKESSRKDDELFRKDEGKNDQKSSKRGSKSKDSKQ